MALLHVFRAENHQNQAGGDWKRVSSDGNRSFYSYRCFAFGTTGLPSFKLPSVYGCFYVQLVTAGTGVNEVITPQTH